MKQYEKDAYKISILADLVDDNKPLSQLLEVAKFSLDSYRGNDNMFNDELNDDNPKVQQQAKQEMQQLRRFIKKYNKLVEA